MLEFFKIFMFLNFWNINHCLVSLSDHPTQEEKAPFQSCRSRFSNVFSASQKSLGAYTVCAYCTFDDFIEIHACVNVSEYVCVCVCVVVRVYARVCVCMCVCVYICVCKCVSMYIHIYMCVCIYTCVYIYTHVYDQS